MALWAIPEMPYPEIETRRAKIAFVTKPVKRVNAADTLRLAKFQTIDFACEDPAALSDTS